jgi:glutathione S-transferase
LCALLRPLTTFVFSSASPDACVQKCFDSLLEGKRFFLGPDTLSYADLALYNVLTVADETVFDPETYLAAKFPNVRRHMDAVEAHPAVAAYIRSGRRRPAFVPYSF